MKLGAGAALVLDVTDWCRLTTIVGISQLAPLCPRFFPNFNLRANRFLLPPTSLGNIIAAATPKSSSRHERPPTLPRTLIDHSTADLHDPC